MKHKFKSYEWSHGQVAALCTCGYKTKAYSRAGMAGAELDRHAEEASIDDAS